jgi:hypothetical protein
MATIVHGRRLEEPVTAAGYKPSELAALDRTDPAKAKSIRASNAARENPECAVLFCDMAYACHKALGRDGAPLSPKEQDDDIAALNAADPGVLDPAWLARVKSLTGQLRSLGWDG